MFIHFAYRFYSGCDDFRQELARSEASLRRDLYWTQQLCPLVNLRRAQRHRQPTWVLIAASQHSLSIPGIFPLSMLNVTTENVFKKQRVRFTFFLERSAVRWLIKSWIFHECCMWARAEIFEAACLVISLVGAYPSIIEDAMLIQWRNHDIPVEKVMGSQQQFNLTTIIPAEEVCKLCIACPASN